MNQKNIGEYIAKKRKEKKLTQQELADKIHVSVKAISKWECGKGIPEITNLQCLAKELNVSIIDILNGKDSKKEDVVVEYVKKKDKNSKSKIYVLSIIIVLLVVLFLLGLYFLNNFNKIYAYRLNGESEHFSYDGGFVLTSNYSNIISTGNVNIKDKEFEKEISILNIELICGDKRVIADNNLNEKSYLALEKAGYNELLSNNYNKEEWTIEIIYLLDKEVFKEKIDLHLELIFKNDKLLVISEKNISDDESKVINGVDYTYALDLRNYLIETKGFHGHEDDFEYVTKTQKNEKGELISSIHVMPFSGVIRGLYNFDNIQITLNYSYYNIVTNKKINNNTIHLSGERQELSEESDDNQNNHSKKYFTISFNMGTGESECTYGECPENHWEISKTIYDDLSYILDY